MRDLLRFSALFLLFLGFATELSAQDYSRGRLQKMYVSFLSSEGYETSIDSDGDVRFVRNGNTYFIDVSENDLSYFRIVLANINSIDSEAERARATSVALQATADKKVVKVYIVRDNVWVSCETFIADPEDFKEIFDRMLSAMDSAVAQFAEGMM